MTKQERHRANWCCMMCGLRYGKLMAARENYIYWHDGKCDVCKAEKPVANIKDFNYFNK